MKKFDYSKLDKKPKEMKTKLAKREGEVMIVARKDVVTVPPTITIKGAAETMVEYRTRRLPITHPGTKEIYGIVVSRDIIDFLGGGDKHRLITEKFDGNFFQAINASIKNIMSREVFYIDSKASIDEAIKNMIKFDVGGFPVVEDSKVCGIVEEKDIVQRIAGAATGVFVEEIMTENVITIPPGTTISYATKFMIRNDIRRLPVIFDGKLVGIVTTTDILKHFATNEIFRSSEPLQEKISKIMVKVFTVEKNTDVGDAVMLMRSKNVGCLPVTENENLIGIVSERDVLKLF